MTSDKTADESALMANGAINSANPSILPSTSAALSCAEIAEDATSAKLPAEKSPQPPRNRSRKDFLFLEELGEGSFSTVFLASERETSRRFAVKVCYKTQIIREKKIAQIFREKEILQLLSTKANAHPFIVQLFCTFQDNDSLYFVLTLATRKDLLKKLRKEKRFSVAQCRFVASEVLSALAHIHSFRVVHRDLKPENLLLTEDGHVLVSDFGCAKRLDAKEAEKETEGPATTTKTAAAIVDETTVGGGGGGRKSRRRTSFVGTSFYVSPEVLNGEEVTESCDYWTFGVIVFEMLAGRRPFSDVSEYLTYQRILKLLYNFDDGFPAAAEGADDLVRRLLVIDARKRLGAEAAGGCERVKAHVFFAGVDWAALTSVRSPLL